jgi:hypothetical protein
MRRILLAALLLGAAGCKDGGNPILDSYPFPEGKVFFTHPPIDFAGVQAFIGMGEPNVFPKNHGGFPLLHPYTLPANVPVMAVASGVIINVVPGPRTIPDWAPASVRGRSYTDYGLHLKASTTITVNHAHVTTLHAAILARLATCPPMKGGTRWPSPSPPATRSDGQGRTPPWTDVVSRRRDGPRAGIPARAHRRARDADHEAGALRPQPQGIGKPAGSGQGENPRTVDRTPIQGQGPRRTAGTTPMPSARLKACGPVLITMASSRSAPIFSFSQRRCLTSASVTSRPSFTSIATTRWSARSTIRSTS